MNDKVQSIMALVDRYETACATSTLGCQSTRAIEARTALESAIREAIAAPGVAPGWVTVPLEPTPTMLAALWAYKANTLAEQYAAMLAAAPSPIAEQPVTIKGGPAE